MSPISSHVRSWRIPKLVILGLGAVGMLALLTLASWLLLGATIANSLSDTLTVYAGNSGSETGICAGLADTANGYWYCAGGGDPPFDNPDDYVSGSTVIGTIDEWVWAGETSSWFSAKYRYDDNPLRVQDEHAFAWAMAHLNQLGFDINADENQKALQALVWSLAGYAIDWDSGDYIADEIYGNIYSGFGDRLTREQGEACKRLHNEALKHKGEAGPWDRSCRIWIIHDNDRQNVLELLPFGNIELHKESADTAISAGNSCYSLKGAVYGIYSTQTEAEAATHSNPGSPVATLTTDESGNATSANLPAGMYYVKETTAAQGYALDEAVYSVEVTNSNTAKVNGGAVYDWPQTNLIDTLVVKVDAETGKQEALGSATLTGAEFSVYYFAGYFDNAKALPTTEDGLLAYTRHWVLKTDETGWAGLAAAYSDPATYLVEGDDFYLATNSDGSASPTLPLGTVYIKETKAPEGYLLNTSDGPLALQQIKPDGSTLKTVSLYVEPTSENPTIADQVKRGDFNFNKVDGATMEELPGVAFLVSSNTTGEAHVLVSDVNGEVNTQASFVPHTQNTNANDPTSENTNGAVLIDEDGNWYVADTSKLDSDAGIWFSGTLEQTTRPDDSLGALPYDSYTIKELPSSTNADHELAEFTLKVSRNNQTINRGTIDDNPIEHIMDMSTHARDSADGDQVIDEGKDATIVDTVSITGLSIGNTYCLKATFVDKETTEAVELNTIEGMEENGSLIFEATEEDMDVEVPIMLKAEQVTSSAYVVFEKLELVKEGEETLEEPTVVLLHEDLNNTEQTITVEKPPVEPPTERLVQTGDTNPAPLFLAAGSASILLLMFVERKALRQVFRK